MTDSMGNSESQPLWTNIRAAFMAAMKLCEEAEMKQELFEAKQEELIGMSSGRLNASAKAVSAMVRG